MALFKKGTKLYSISNFKCPHCHEGDFFEAHPYNLAKTGNTGERCKVCNRKFEREPGFYYGGMYVAYGLAVGLFVTIWVSGMVLYPEATAMQMIWAIVIGMVLAGPMLYALSKIIWANLFFKYKGVEPTIEELEKRTHKPISPEHPTPAGAE